MCHEIKAILTSLKSSRPSLLFDRAMSVSGRCALTVTMWAGWTEWDEAYSWLFAMDDAAARDRGVARVATWRSRGRLPLAVEATASLVEAGLALSPAGGAVSSICSKQSRLLVTASFRRRRRSPRCSAGSTA